MDANFNRKTLILSMILGMIFFPLFYLLDISMYPNYKTKLLLLRISMSIISFFLLLIVLHGKEKYVPIATKLSLFVYAFGISFMCYIVKEGFASPYYTGIILVIIFASEFLRFNFSHFLIVVSAILIQHFTLLLFLPYEIKDLLKNIFFLTSSAAIAAVSQFTIFRLTRKVKALESFLPICSCCKRIRDDKNNWYIVEKYIEESTKVKVSHGICPDCLNKVYSFDNIKKWNPSGRSRRLL
jgi:hypothetical protein